MSRAPKSRFKCDAPHCRSVCEFDRGEFTDSECLRLRGWVESETPEDGVALHYCPAHRDYPERVVCVGVHSE